MDDGQKPCANMVSQTDFQAGELVYQNNRLMMFPNYSVETQKLCCSCDSVKAALHTKIKYSALFPA